MVGPVLELRKLVSSQMPLLGRKHRLRSVMTPASLGCHLGCCLIVGRLGNVYLVFPVPMASSDLVISLPASRKATKQRERFILSRKLCSEGSFFLWKGRPPISLFGDDLYEYAMRKHNRPTLNRKLGSERRHGFMLPGGDYLHPGRLI